MKLTIIGAGSTYTPEVLDGLLNRQESFPVQEIALMDIDQSRLQVVAEFCERMSAARNGKFKLTITNSLHEAVSGADFIITQIRVGRQKGRHWDINLGRRHGIIGQETTGVGGFSKAMRTIPEIMEICQVIENVAPNAWLINFTNPSGIITEAISRFSNVKVIGLCNVPVNMQMDIAELLQANPEEVSLDYVGLNHLAWVRRVYYRGQDVIDEVLTKAINQPSNISKTKVATDFIEALRMIPSPYLKYFYNTPEIIAEQKEATETRAEQVMKVEEELLKLYADPSISEKPESLSKRGGAYYSHAAMDIMESIYKDAGKVLVVNTANDGAITGFNAEDILEIPAVIGNRPPQPLVIGDLEPEINGLMAQVKAYERLTVEAGVEKSYQKSLLALSTNPLVQGVEQSKSLLAEINDHYNLKLN